MYSLFNDLSKVTSYTVVLALLDDNLMKEIVEVITTFCKFLRILFLAIVICLFFFNGSQD